jgi:hypothetical protein
MSGIELIAAERERQVSVEGWTPEHDDKHDSGSLVAAAVTYALEATYDGPAVKGEWFKKILVLRGSLVQAFRRQDTRPRKIWRTHCRRD